jgi:hypothetical protein
MWIVPLGILGKGDGKERCTEKRDVEAEKEGLR